MNSTPEANLGAELDGLVKQMITSHSGRGREAGMLFPNKKSHRRTFPLRGLPGSMNADLRAARGDGHGFGEDAKKGAFRRRPISDVLVVDSLPYNPSEHGSTYIYQRLTAIFAGTNLRSPLLAFCHMLEEGSATELGEQDYQINEGFLIIGPEVVPFDSMSGSVATTNILPQQISSHTNNFLVREYTELRERPCPELDGISLTLIGSAAQVISGASRQIVDGFRDNGSS